VFPVRYELGFHIPLDDILHSHRRENLRSYKALSDDIILVRPCYYYVRSKCYRLIIAVRIERRIVLASCKSGLSADYTVE
jgi:hypothetical protein